MSTFLSILGGLGSGGLLGLLGSCVTGWLEIKKVAQANAHQLALLDAQRTIAADSAAARAFEASHHSAAAETGRESPWAATFRVITRPALTWILVLAAVVLALRSGAASDLAARVLFFAEMAVGWWFGSRSTFSRAK